MLLSFIASKIKYDFTVIDSKRNKIWFYCHSYDISVSTGLNKNWIFVFALPESGLLSATVTYEMLQKQTPEVGVQLSKRRRPRRICMHSLWTRYLTKFWINRYVLAEKRRITNNSGSASFGVGFTARDM